ncbi:hypothetical protein BU16DRAFT_530430 [Lophium mytilinum]|uniref:Cell wall mannoprotein PIR1-like C-terminal domain-containing protein n=1 Tax=Lophium mytilinum TaxID=390894 RepID=A0A6A6QGQ8_9PEZI|nr:hypothetical protein BU16DRAFT_530430 [Lophium mytilinum]
MRVSTILAGLGLAASVVAQGVSEGIAPTAAAPAGCKPTFAGKFTINVQDLSFGVKEASSQILASAVTVTLNNGILIDSHNRVGAIVANHQFQFDGPPQAGSIYTGGWSACANDSLALGGTTLFYACTSGEFRNLYDEYVGAQCSPINIIIIPVDKPSSSSSVAATTVASSSASASKTIVSKADTTSETASTSSPTVTLSSVLKNSTVATSVNSKSKSLLVETTLSSLATGGSTATPTGASATGASSAVSTGAAMATAIARDLIGAAVGAFGAAVILF